MGSIIVLPSGKKLDYDRAFEDQGKPPVMGMMGGQRTIFETGTPPKPSIYQRGDAFFTKDGKPITDEVAKPWLEDPSWPEHLKALVRKFLAKVKGGKPVTERLDRVRKPKPEPRRTHELAPEEAGLSSQRPEKV
jgi:hypothetical protein